MPGASGRRCSAATGPTSAPRPLPSRPPRTSSATAPRNPPAPSTRSSPTCGRPGPGRPTSTNNTNAWPVNATPSSRSPRSRPATHRDAERLRSDEVDARRRWLEARQRVVDLDAALTSETADLQTRVWGAWRQELSQARRAAEVVRDGAGRLGQHRRQVRDAGAELTAFAARWHPAVPDLATDPAELADQVMWLHGRRVEDPINAFVARTVADAHPDADQIRETERDAHAAYDRAERSRTHLDEAMYAELRPYGQAAHTRDAGGRLAAVVGPTGRCRTRPAHRHRTRRCPPARAERSSAPRLESTASANAGPPTASARQQAAAREAKRAPAAPARDTADRAAPTEPEHSRPRAGHRPLNQPHRQAPANDVRSSPQAVAFQDMDNSPRAQLHGPPVIAPGGAAHLGDRQALSIPAPAVALEVPQTHQQGEAHEHRTPPPTTTTTQTTRCSASRKPPRSSASPSPPCATGATSAPARSASRSAATSATGAPTSSSG